MRLRGNRSSPGFSLLEVAVSVVVIAILVGLLLVAVQGLRRRAQRLQCATNLKNLGVAANLYVQQYDGWPQISAGAGTSGEQFAEAWIAALKPFGPERKTWICPTMQNFLQNPDYTKPENARIDYFATPFDSNPTSPHRWPRQPWFVESGDVHGSGNLILFTDGSISDLKTVFEEARGGR
jgi:prepilin-type N-terminal cleavage/methylation domain-containing protein